MSMTFKTVLAVAGVVVATQAAAQVTFYEREGFRGQSFTTDRPVWNMDRVGFDDRATSAVVAAGNWQVCEDTGFRGRCVVLQPGEYPNLREVGLNNDISSVRPAEGRADYGSNRERYNIAQNDQYRRRDDERVVEVPVTSVRAVVGPPEQRCWVERQEVEGRSAPNVGGAIGANIGRNGEVYSQDVQRCTSVPSNAPPDYWDVTYTFRGQVHHVQMSAPPGPTIAINESSGEPRM